MFLTEPPTTAYDLHFPIAGVPVRVHPMFWLAGLVMAASGGRDVTGVLIWIGVLFVSILIHELGHAFAMRKFRESPRVVLYMMGGLAISDGGGNPLSGRSKSRNSFEQIIISAAGPTAGFLFAALIVVAVNVGGGTVKFHRPDIHEPIFWSVGKLSNPHLFYAVHDLLFVNIVWGLVNLLPVMPLDGGQIARQLITMRDPWDGVRKSLWLSTIVAGAFAAMGVMYWGSPMVGIMFGMLAASNYMSLQQIGGGGRGGRPW